MTVELSYRATVEKANTQVQSHSRVTRDVSLSWYIGLTRDSLLVFSDHLDDPGCLS